jgi:hypothetical protein
MHCTCYRLWDLLIVVHVLLYLVGFFYFTARVVIHFGIG